MSTKNRDLLINLIIIITLVLLLSTLFTCAANASNLQDSSSRIINNQGGIDIMELISLLLAPTGIFGLWAKYTMDRKERVKADKESTNKIIEKIELNDIAQNKKIEIIEEKMGILLEAEKINLGVKQLKLNLEQTTALILDNIEEESIKESVTYGVASAINVFSGIVLQDFKLDIDSLNLQMKVAINKIVGFDSTTTFLVGEELYLFKKDLHYKLTILSESFIMDIGSTFKMINGERRAKFIDQCNTFVKQCIIQSIALYKDHINHSKNSKKVNGH